MEISHSDMIRRYDVWLFGLMAIPGFYTYARQAYDYLEVMKPGTGWIMRRVTITLNYAGNRFRRISERLWPKRNTVTGWYLKSHGHILSVAFTFYKKRVSRHRFPGFHPFPLFSTKFL